MFGNPENVTYLCKSGRKAFATGTPGRVADGSNGLDIRLTSLDVAHTARAIPTEMTAPNTSGRCLLQQVRLLLPCVHCRYRFGTRPLPEASSLHGTQYSSS